MYAFGKMMRKLIAEHGTTQAEISRATGINKQNIPLECYRRSIMCAQCADVRVYV